MRQSLTMKEYEEIYDKAYVKGTGTTAERNLRFEVMVAEKLAEKSEERRFADVRRV